MVFFDNGVSVEGSENGIFNEMIYFNGVLIDIVYNIEY